MSKPCKKVVLVEDNQAEAKLTKIAFNGLEYNLELVHCSNGEQFIQLLQAFSPNEICYVLLDLNMPRLNGIEVLEHLAKDKSWQHLPIIIFTSSAFEKDIHRCYKLGAKAYVVKPVEFEDLEKRLEAINSFWAGANRLPHFGVKLPSE